MNGIAPLLREQLELAVYNGVEVLDNTFRENFSKHNRRNVVLRGDDAADSKNLLAIKNRFRDEDLYGQRIRLEQNKNNMKDWRSQMKSLEELKEHRVVYDRIGKKEKTLLQERREAKLGLTLKEKRKYKHERHVYKIDDFHKRRLSNTLDVKVNT